MNDLTILCRNCNKFSLNDYYGFCSTTCYTDFAHRYNLTLNEAIDCSIGKDYADVERLEHELLTRHHDWDDIKKEKDRYMNDVEDLQEKSIELKITIKNQESAIQTLKEEKEDLIFAIRKLRHYDERFQNMEF